MVSIVAGGPVHGSWWGHSKGHLIFQIGGKVAADPDVMMMKLLSGKDTYVHRGLWSLLLVIATAKESWQLQGLPSGAVLLLNEVESRGELRTHEFAHDEQIDVKILGESARQLERRLLVYGEDIHAQSGFHAKLLRSWSRWMKVVGFMPTKASVTEARRELETRIENINQKFGAKARLPWR